MIQGAAGIPWLLQKQGAAEPRYAPMIVADRSVGQQVASAVSAALYSPREDRQGPARRRADVRAPAADDPRRPPRRLHLRAAARRARLHRILAPDRRPYQTKDGYVCALIYNDKQWKAFFDIIGKPEMLARPEFATQEARSKNYDTAYALVADELKKRTTAEWLEALERADIPVQRMNSLDDIVADPHLAAIGYLQTVEHPTEGRIKHAGGALRVVGVEARVPPPRAAPRRAHARGAAAKPGLSDEKIDTDRAGADKELRYNPRAPI